MSQLPLRGIKVVEVAANLAGPFAAEILAHLGADVLKIERPSGDDARHWGDPVQDATGPSFHAINLNKRSAVMDLREPAQLARLQQLIGEADVLVQNMRPGLMEEMGLGAEAMRARNPRLIYVSVGAFGTSGPMKHNPGYEPMVQAFSGLMMLQNAADGGPQRIGTQVLDHGTGMWAALGCLAGLVRRAATGEGCTVDTSLFETALGWLTIPGAQLQCHGTLPERHPTGSSRLIPFQGFDTRNGQVVIAAGNDRLFVKLAEALGRPDLARDPRLARNAGRLEHKDWLLAELQKVLLTKTKGEWIDILSAVDVPCAPINAIEDVLKHPQTVATGMLQAVPGLGIELMTLPVKLDGERPKIRSMAPRLGEHTAEVLPAKAAE